MKYQGKSLGWVCFDKQHNCTRICLEREVYKKGTRWSKNHWRCWTNSSQKKTKAINILIVTNPNVKEMKLLGEKNYNNIKLYKTYIVYKNYRSTEEEE